MSEENTNTDTGAANVKALFAFKVGMSSVYNENGERVPVTVLRYEPMVVSQVKTKESDGYEAVQMGFVADRASQTNKANKTHLGKAGFENGAKFLREIRVESAADFKVGAKVDLSTFQKGDVIELTGLSKGHGFSGVVRRWNFAGGPASHGSGFHRTGGSVGNRTWPGRVIPGKRMAGQYGNETVTIKNIQVVDVIAEENVILLKGSVPGSRNSLVKLMKA